MLNVADARLFAECYLAGADPRDPYASPLYGNLAGLPPTLIHVGSDEILRDDAVRMAENLEDAGCRVEIEVWPRMPHVWHLFAPALPEAGQAIARIGAFADGVFASPLPKRCFTECCEAPEFEPTIKSRGARRL